MPTYRVLNKPVFRFFLILFLTCGKFRACLISSVFNFLYVRELIQIKDSGVCGVGVAVFQ